LLFATAAFYYNNLEEQEEFKEKLAKTEVVKTELDDLEDKDLEESDPNNQVPYLGVIGSPML